MRSETAKIGNYGERLAAALYRWKSLQDRHTHPTGTFDNARRWYPDEGEKQECCERIHSPSRTNPYSYLVHCRSYEHVARQYNVEIGDLRREAKCCAVSKM